MPKLKDLIEALAKHLPPGTISFGCHVASVDTDSGSHGTLISTVGGIGQGGSAALEDAVVLARSISRALPGGVHAVTSDLELHKKISAAMGKYVRERRARVFTLSLEAFVTGALLTAKSLAKYLVLVPILVLLGSESRRHTNYDCGRL
jgi:hypothetical protein